MFSLQVLLLVGTWALVNAGVTGQLGYDDVYGGFVQGDYGNNDVYVHNDYYHYPKYNFDYAVHDPHTGDHKSQWETRDGDVVKGGYTVAEPDGTTRIVEYTADKHNGFNAVVKRVGQAHHPQQYNNYQYNQPYNQYY